MQRVERLPMWWEMLGVVVHMGSKAGRKQKEREGEGAWESFVLRANRIPVL